MINLDRSPDRLEFIASQMKRLGLDFIRLSATDAAGISDAEFERLGGVYMRPISRSELACLHSHSRAWRHCADAGRPVLVLEDDVVLSDRLPVWLAELAEMELPGIVNIETRGAEKWVSKKPVATAPDSGVSLYRLYVDRGGSGGYLVQPAVARALLRRAEHSAAPADAFLNLSGVERLQTEPGLATPLYDAGEPADGFRAAFRTTIRAPSKASRLELIVRRPKFKLRRLAGHIAMTARKLKTIGVGVRRAIEICPSILDHAAKRSA
ncbi:MAG: glycosyltransferase family 25 protein [Pseudaminobacter sp.]|nr:glycosyltransferase family 25 protein [Pseudaminobacter sp.]